MIKPFEFYFDFASPYTFLAHKEIRRIEKANEDISKFKPLIKLYDRADIINDIA